MLVEAQLKEAKLTLDQKCCRKRVVYQAESDVEDGYNPMLPQACRALSPGSRLGCSTEPKATLE